MIWLYAVLIAGALLTSVLGFLQAGGLGANEHRLVGAGIKAE